MDNPKLNKAKELMVMGLLASLTLGLAPFFPEPHIVGKVRWILGGAVGMKAIDWMDALMHGAPFLILMYAVANYFLIKGKS